MNVAYVNGQLAVYRGGNLLATTTGLTLGTNWHYIEFKVTCGASGSYELRVAGETVLTESAISTKAGSHDYHDCFQLQCYSKLVIYFDDLYFLDSTGSSNNDFLDNCRVVAISPSAAGDSAQLIPSAGANYECVDEALMNDDTDYVESGTDGYKDLYNYTNPEGVLGDIFGCQVNTVCRETDASTFNLVTICKSGVTESDDTEQLIGTTNYVFRTRLLEVNPDTSDAWTESGLNSVQFGIKVS
jgi:hypothetical protein